jgi:hypothetical protein
MYQARFALFHLLEMDEDSHVLIEKQDDIDFEERNGILNLASLKHKQSSDKLTDLGTDFWKSVRVWLASYKQLRQEKDLRFLLFTTAEAVGTFSKRFLLNPPPAAQDKSLSKSMSNQTKTASTYKSLSEQAEELLNKSKSEIASKVAAALAELTDTEKEDFFSRITIFDSVKRIDELPDLIMKKHMKSIARNARPSVFQRLEGWWNHEVILLLTGKRVDPLVGAEVSDMLSKFADEYKSDNLPITFGSATPELIDTINDKRIFVSQLREIGINSDRIRYAIIDYYRAFEQRSAWARENLLVSGEMERYEDRLVEEWDRYRAILFDNLNDSDTEPTLKLRGEELYRWAQSQCLHIKVRERVDEAFVVRGNFQMLANEQPPRVYWHPQFLERLETILGVDN